MGPNRAVRIVKRKLATRLNVGIAVAIVLAVAMLGTTVWIALEFEEASVEERQSIAAAAALAEAESGLWQLRYGFPEFMIANSERRKQILAEESKWYSLIEANLDAYARTVRTTAEAEALFELRAQYARYKDARPKFFELYAAGRVEEAAAWRALATTPYGAATVKAFGRLVNLQRVQGEESGRRELEWMRRNRIVVAALSAFLLLLLGVGYWGANRTLRTIRELDARAQRVLREQLGETLEITPSGNEVDGLMKSFDMLVDAFTSRAAALSEADTALKLQHEALEKTVAARTVEIESANRMLAARERQTRSITDLTGLLQTVRDIDEAARILPRFLGPLFAPHAGALYIAKPSLNYLDALVRWGDASFTESFDFADCWALRRGEAHEVNGSGLACPHSDAHAAHDYLCAPMVSQGTTFGLLHVAYASAATGDAGKRERREHARYITEQLALALANLRLRDALRNQALRDPLTGLFNRRYLEESLERELARAKRENQPLSLLMLDVDHFKRFNDTNGHEAGDAVLRALGRTLIECTRGGDIACRFGGEEFAVMLPGADADQAANWATRLIDRVRALSVRADGQLLAGVTISVGLACYPRGGEDAEVLVRAADAALYEAKRAGRDRLVAAEEIASAAA